MTKSCWGVLSSYHYARLDGRMMADFGSVVKPSSAKSSTKTHNTREQQHRNVHGERPRSIARPKGFAVTFTLRIVRLAVTDKWQLIS